MNHFPKRVFFFRKLSHFPIFVNNLKISWKIIFQFPLFSFAEIELFFKRRQLYLYLNYLFLAWRESFFVFVFFEHGDEVASLHAFLQPKMNPTSSPRWTSIPFQSLLSKPYLGPPNHPFLNMGSPYNCQLFSGSFFLNSSSFTINARAPIYDLWDSIIRSLYYVNDYCNWE